MTNACKEEKDKDLVQERRQRHAVGRARVSRLAAEIPLRPEVQSYDLEDVNRALGELKTRKIRGAKVVRLHPAGSTV